MFMGLANLPFKFHFCYLNSAAVIWHVINDKGARAEPPSGSNKISKWGEGDDAATFILSLSLCRFFSQSENLSTAITVSNGSRRALQKMQKFSIKHHFNC